MDRIDRPRGRLETGLLVVAALGLAAFGVTLVVSPARAWGNLLLANYYAVSLALYGAVFVALSYVLSAGWATVFRRVPEAMSTYLPIGAVFMLALFFGREHLYVWARPETVADSPLLQHKAAYLNTPFFFVRMGVAFAIWSVLAHRIRQHSSHQDADGELAHTRRNRTLSAVFLLLFTGTFIFASIDWLMSLEPEWTSTIFPAYCGAGVLLGGSAAMAALLVTLARREQLPGLTDSHVYEVSRIICATSTLWAYIWFSQYMLIYYANIPEEGAYFAHRLAGGWSFVFWLNPVLNWAVPLVILIPASARRSSCWLLTASGVVLVGRWVDLYLLVMPSLGRSPTFGATEVLMLAGFASLFLFTFLRRFAAVGRVPKQDPYLVESLHLRS